MQIPNTLDRPKFVVFNGTSFRLMGGKKTYYLSQSNTNKGRRGAKGLHVAIYEFYSGQKVQKGFEIHHKDGNGRRSTQANNDIDNLITVCQGCHLQHHPGRIKMKV